MPKNQILEAFIRGNEQKKQSEQSAKDEEFRQKQLKQQQDEFKLQYDELLRQHDLENARAQSLAEFTQAAAKLKQQEEIQAHYATYGLAPSGSTVTESNPATFSEPRTENSNLAINTAFGTSSPEGATNASIPTTLYSNNIPSGQVKITDPRGESLNALTPEAAAQLQAKILDITQKPIIERQFEKEKQILEGQKSLKELELKAQEIKDQNSHKARLDEINLQNQGRIEAAKVRGQEAKDVKLDAPIDPKAQRDEFGLTTYDPTLTLKKAAGLGLIKPLSPTQEDKNADFSDLLLKTQEVKNLLEQIDPKTGKSYYQSYFGGGLFGIGTEIKGKVSSLPPEVEKIRQKLASIELKAKNAVGKLGGALTTNEQTLLEQEAPSPSFTKTPARAKSIVDGFLEGLTRSQQELIKSQKTGNKPPSNIIKHDKDGNVIK